MDYVARREGRSFIPGFTENQILNCSALAWTGYPLAGEAGGIAHLQVRGHLRQAGPDHGRRIVFQQRRQRLNRPVPTVSRPPRNSWCRQLEK